jgi:hypothetical protein
MKHPFRTLLRDLFIMPVLGLMDRLAAIFPVKSDSASAEQRKA